MPAFSMPGEKPNTAPPRPAPSTLAPCRRSSQYMAAAEPAYPSVTRTVRLASGPASSVTGASATAGNSTELFHISGKPYGAFSAVVTSAGRCP
jgi:hypothetical protein